MSQHDIMDWFKKHENCLLIPSRDYIEIGIGKPSLSSNVKRMGADLGQIEIGFKGTFPRLPIRAYYLKKKAFKSNKLLNNMKLVNGMIATDGKDFYMKEAYCSKCGYKKNVPCMERKTPCSLCYKKNHCYMDYRWKCIGSKLDYSEYYTPKTDRHLRQGKNE